MLHFLEHPSAITSMRVWIASFGETVFIVIHDLEYPEYGYRASYANGAGITHLPKEFMSRPSAESALRQISWRLMQ